MFLEENINRVFLLQEKVNLMTILSWKGPSTIDVPIGFNTVFPEFLKYTLFHPFKIFLTIFTVTPPPLFKHTHKTKFNPLSLWRWVMGHEKWSIFFSQQRSFPFRFN